MKTYTALLAPVDGKRKKRQRSISLNRVERCNKTLRHKRKDEGSRTTLLRHTNEKRNATNDEKHGHVGRLFFTANKSSNFVPLAPSFDALFTRAAEVKNLARFGTKETTSSSPFDRAFVAVSKSSVRFPRGRKFRIERDKRTRLPVGAGSKHTHTHTRSSRDRCHPPRNAECGRHMAGFFSPNHHHPMAEQPSGRPINHPCN